MKTRAEISGDFCFHYPVLCFIVGFLMAFAVVVMLYAGLDRLACQQKAEAYNIETVWKFPAGCMIPVLALEDRYNER